MSRSKEKDKKNNHNSYIRHREKRLKQNKEWIENHREQRRKQQREWSRIYNRQLKNTVLTFYGNGEARCILCGESRIECLSIDHINGGGNKQRIETKMIGPRFYKWLINSKFPDEYRTLCMNCQFVERAKMYESKLL